MLSLSHRQHEPIFLMLQDNLGSALGLRGTETLTLHCLPCCWGSGAEKMPCPFLPQQDERAHSKFLLLPKPSAPRCPALAMEHSSLRSPVQPALPCSRQLESSAGENTISIIGTVRLYPPSWQRGNMFCLTAHRGQIVSSCSSLPRIPWEPVKGHILPSSLTKEHCTQASGMHRAKLLGSPSCSPRPP